MDVSDCQHKALNITTEESFHDIVSHDRALEHLQQSIPEAESTILGIKHEDHGESIFND